MSISQSRAWELQLKLIHFFCHKIAGPHLRNTWPDMVKFVPRVQNLSMANFLHDDEVWQAHGRYLSSLEKPLYNCFSSHQDCSCLFKHHGLCWLHREKGTKLKEYDICLKVECWNFNWLYCSCFFSNTVDVFYGCVCCFLFSWQFYTFYIIFSLVLN